MRQIRFYEYGGPEVLRVEEAQEPEPGPGELLIATEAIGVTLPAVRMVRGEGARAPLPGVIGGEIAGTVVAVGAGTGGFDVGDRVHRTGLQRLLCGTSRRASAAGQPHTGRGDRSPGSRLGAQRPCGASCPGDGQSEGN